jgi:divalent metal cation (Fe/Co/Zn/Cd) transporter
MSDVQIHLEPLAETAGAAEVSGDVATVRAVVREVAGVEPRDLRFLNTDDGLVAHLTLRLGAGRALADAHARASEIEERIRRLLPEVADVVVHTEPGE